MSNLLGYFCFLIVSTPDINGKLSSPAIIWLFYKYLKPITQTKAFHKAGATPQKLPGRP
jgi:hypothetical protein